MKDKIDRAEVVETDGAKERRAVFHGLPAVAAKYGIAMHMLEGALRENAGSITLTHASRPVMREALRFYRDWLLDEIEMFNEQDEEES